MGEIILAALILSYILIGIAESLHESPRDLVQALGTLFFFTSITILPAFQMVGFIDLADSVLISFQFAILLTAAFIVR